MRLLRCFKVVVAVLIVSMLAACSGGKPEDTLDRFYRAAEKGDVDTAVKQMSFASVPAEKMVQAKGKIQMIVGEAQNLIKANGGYDSLEVIESKIAEDGKTATVRAKLKFKNGKDKSDSARLVKEDDGWKIVLR
jgi:major membrane immunogen (membrane-anchored lipoprotein)